MSTRTFAALGIVLSTISPIGENTPPVTLTAKFAVSSDWLSINAPQGDTPPATPTAQPMGDANTTAPIGPAPSTGALVDVPADHPTTMYAPGPTAIIVRACVDTNTDRRCTLGEGVAGLPVAVLDATSGDVRATGETNSDGRSAITFTLAEQTRLSVDVVFLALGHTARPDARGTEIVLDAPVLPELLP